MRRINLLKFNGCLDDDDKNFVHMQTFFVVVSVAF